MFFWIYLSWILLTNWTRTNERPSWTRMGPRLWLPEQDRVKQGYWHIVSRTCWAREYPLTVFSHWRLPTKPHGRCRNVLPPSWDKVTLPTYGWEPFTPFSPKFYGLRPSISGTRPISRYMIHRIRKTWSSLLSRTWNWTTRCTNPTTCWDASPWPRTTSSWHRHTPNRQRSLLPTKRPRNPWSRKYTSITKPVASKATSWISTTSYCKRIFSSGIFRRYWKNTRRSSTTYSWTSIRTRTIRSILSSRNWQNSIKTSAW